MALAFARKSGRRPAAKPAKRPAAPGLVSPVLPVQAKLEVGPAHDRFEQEADRIADRIMRVPDGVSSPPPAIAPLSLQRKTAKPPPEEIEPAQRKTATPTPEDREPVQRAPEQRKQEEIKPLCEECALQRAAEKAEVTVTPDEEPEKRKGCRDKPLPGLQRKGGDGSGPAPAGVQSTIDRARAGRGAPLPPATRSFMEPRLGRDLGHVRVHDGAPAAEASRAVGAKAFTVGNDVFFGAGRYRPETGEGRRLIAHELVHTVQQGGGSSLARPARLQRDEDANAKSQITPMEEAKEDPKVFDPGKATVGRIDAKPEKRKRGTLYLPALKIPFFNAMPKGAAGNGAMSGRPAPGKNKIQAGQPYQFLGPTDRSGRQREVWRTRARNEFAGSLKAALPTRVEGWGSAEVFRPQAGAEPVYYLRRKGKNAPPIMIGTLESLAQHEIAVLPAWDEKGEIASFDVDHLHELQLGGLDDWENLWMLESSANRSSGSLINNDLDKRIGDLIAAGRKGKFWTEQRGGPEPTTEEVRAGWRLMIASFEPVTPKGKPDLHHTRDDVKAGEHLGGLRALDAGELGRFGLEPGDKPTVLRIYPGPDGGFPKTLKLDRKGVPQLPEKAQERYGFYRGFFVASDGLTYRPPSPDDAEGAPVGSVRGLAFKKKNEKGELFEPAPVEMPLNKSAALGLNVYIDRSPLNQALRNLKVKGMSLLAIDEAGITADGALFANGRILATKALFPGLEIPVQLLGDEVFVSFAIPSDRLNLGPLAVRDVNLRIGAGADGLFVAGGAGIVIEGLGHGAIAATVAKRGTQISGNFDFDLAFLEGTSGKFRYDFASDALSITLEKEVKNGALPGVASGHVSVTISRGAAGGGEGGQEAGEGTAQPAGPAAAGTAIGLSGELKLAGPLAGTVVTVVWDPKEGVVIGADDIPLPVSKIPGVSNAAVSVRARRHPETGEWRVSGGGAADLAIAGVTGKLSAAVDGSAVTISGMGRFSKGPVSGFVAFLATNQKLDPEGNPVPGQAAEAFTISGKGGAEVQLGKILRGSASLEVTPEGSVIIVGEIGLPPTFPVFDKWEDKTELFRLEPPDFPIWGVSVAGIGIGIFAFVDAGITFDAFVGPGIIRDAAVCIRFELDKPEETVVEGGGEFYVPAGAGLTIDLGGGLKAEVLIAEVKGRVGLDGRLGIVAEGTAGVGIRWTPQEGLELGAEISGKARPQFEVNANASITASVDLGLWEPSKTWGPWKKPLGKFGPEMEFGITAPVAWSEARGLDFDLDKIAIQRPTIDAADMMKAAFDRLV